MTNRQIIARNYFKDGHNCAQSVLLAFADELEMKEEELRGIASGFGGGMGKLQLTCGAVTGSFMVFSRWAERHCKNNQEAKAVSVKMIRDFEKEYVAHKGAISCETILGVDMNTVEGLRLAEEKDLFGTVCVDAVVDAVALAEKILAKSYL